MRRAVAPLACYSSPSSLGARTMRGPGEAPDVAGVPWTLVGGLTADSWETVAPSATFDAGRAGCNTYRSSFTAERGAIEIEPPAATRNACAEPAGIMEQESAFLEALSTAARYRVDGIRLRLERADGTIAATFARVG
jgi:hypothetical protein